MKIQSPVLDRKRFWPLVGFSYLWLIGKLKNSIGMLILPSESLDAAANLDNHDREWR